MLSNTLGMQLEYEMVDRWFLWKHHLHTYFGISAFISTIDLSDTGVPALFTTLPSTKTLPIKNMKTERPQQ